MDAFHIAIKCSHTACRAFGSTWALTLERNLLFLRQFDVKFYFGLAGNYRLISRYLSGCCTAITRIKNLLTLFPQWKRTSLEIAVQYF